MTMNVFRLLGDFSHVASIVVLLLKLRASKSAAGVSLKTQELFLLVFVCRYLDLFTHFFGIYNSVMKILYIAATSLTIYMIREQVPIKATYERSQDSFYHVKFAVAPCVLLAVLTHFGGGRGILSLKGFQDLLWIFSIYLEALAIVPQLIVLQRYREVENLTGHYVFFLGAYRALYILNWVYRAYNEKGYRHHWPVYFAGIVQTLLYADFFYYYAISKYYGGRLALPT